MHNFETLYSQKTTEELQSIDDGLDRNCDELSPEKAARRKQIRKILNSRRCVGVTVTDGPIHQQL